MSLLNRSAHWSARVLALAMAAWCLAAVSTAQPYRTDPIDPSVKGHGAKAKRWVSDPAAYATDKANFAAYFQKYYFPAMTRSTPSDLAELGKLRVDLFKKYLWATTNAQLQSDLTGMALKAMGAIVLSKEPYHPSVRYNAILVIGMLDSEYAVEGGASPRPPKPHPTATKALTQIVNASLTSDKFPPPVVLGALIGLERHAKYQQSLAPEAVKAMSDALLKFVNNDKPIQGMDTDAYAWLRLRAASGLANLGSLGEKNEVHNALVKLISTSKSLDDRCTAAGLLGTFKTDKENKYDKAKVDGPTTTAALFKLASDLGAAELKRADDFERNPASAYTTSPAFGAGDDQSQDDGYPRRHVLARLMNLGAGLFAVKPALPEDSQKQVDAVLAAITPVVKAAQDEKTISRRVTFMVREMNQKIVATVGDLSGASDDEDGFSAGESAAAAPVASPPGNAPAAANAPASDAPAAGPEVKAPGAETPAADAPAPAQPEGAKN